MTLPLTGTDLEILRRLNAGQHPAVIRHVGWYRQSWDVADIARVAAYRHALDAMNAADRAREHAERKPAVTSGAKAGRQALPREHGTKRGYYQHRTHGEAACEDCLAGRRGEEGGAA